MISIEEIKQMIIKNETEWIEEIHDDDEIPGLVNGMIDDINDCFCIDDLIEFYTTKGLSIQEGFEAIVMILRENTQVKE
jgi:hypothetical protein